MKKYLLILFSIGISVFVDAQNDTGYLVGAVPEDEGKVVFKKTISANGSISDADLFNLMSKWANEKYNITDDPELVNRVLLSNDDDKIIACHGEQYIVFRRNAFILDQTKMSYQLVMNIESGKCDVAIRNMKYDYSDSKTPIPAEDMISDKVSLSKKGDKLNRYQKKFRVHTIDSIAKIFSSIDAYLNGTTTVTTTIAGAVAPSVSSNSMAAYKQIAVDKIPSKLLNDWTLVVSGEENKVDVHPALWGALGSIFDKTVAFSIFNPKQFSIDKIEKNGVYTISFYTEIYNDAIKSFISSGGNMSEKIKVSGLTPFKTPSGATAFSEAWMIVECKKGGTQPSTQSRNDKESSEGMSKDGYDNTYMGEILNVWVK